MIENNSKFKIGLIINPISGMGGSVGLKGTDGIDILEKARELGAVPNANERTREFLEELKAITSKLTFITPPGVMGSDILNSMNFNYQTVSTPFEEQEFTLYYTTREHTKLSIKEILTHDISILIFVGGDGTARDTFEALGEKDGDIPCLGIPAGVKIHSSVFAINPKTAAKLVMEYLWGEAPLREAEVLDIDEEEFRNNRVVSKLYGYLKIPYSPLYMQPAKMASPTTEDENENKIGIAKWVIEDMKEDIRYFIGPGTTTKPIATLLEQEKTLLGVDLMINKKMVEFDLNENSILENLVSGGSKLIITPIGAQGFVFGRGNLQISSSVIEKIRLKNIIIVCTKYKLSTLPNGKMRVDTRDQETDKKLKGLYRILVDYGEFRIVEIENK